MESSKKKKMESSKSGSHHKDDRKQWEKSEGRDVRIHSFERRLHQKQVSCFTTESWHWQEPNLSSCHLKAFSPRLVEPFPDTSMEEQK